MQGPEPFATALILAAGASTRLGEPKQLARLGGEALLERSIRTAREAGFLPLVVLGWEAQRIACEPWMRGVRHVVNEKWREGMGTSIARGTEAVRNTRAGQPHGPLLVMTCDQPAVSAAHLRQLRAEAAGGEPAASFYAGRKGVPAVFPESFLPHLLALGGDAGARTLLQAARALALDGGEEDVDTPAALAQARLRYGGE